MRARGLHVSPCSLQRRKHQMETDICYVCEYETNATDETSSLLLRSFLKLPTSNSRRIAFRVLMKNCCGERKLDRRPTSRVTQKQQHTLTS